MLTKLLRKLFFGFLDAEAVKIGFYHFNVALGEVDIGVQLEAHQYDERVEVKPDHYNDKCAYGAVYFVVVRKMIDIIREAKRG